MLSGLDSNGVSIIVCNYNSPLEKILATLSSCVFQKDVDFEIIYCDDASKNNYKNEIIAFFKKHSFTNYQLSCNYKNTGTVINILNGLEKAKYSFTKPLGVGDLFYDEYSLANAYRFLKETDCDYLIVKSCYFSSLDNPRVFNRSNPYVTSCYLPKKYNPRKIKRNLIINGDNIAGVAVFCKTVHFYNLLSFFKNKVKYCEDLLYKYSIFVGSKIYYYDSYTIFYEYGSGISQPKNSGFAKIVDEESSIIEAEIKKLYLVNKDKKILSIKNKLDSITNPVLKKMYKYLKSPVQIIIKAKMIRMRKEKPRFAFFNRCKEECHVTLQID